MRSFLAALADDREPAMVPYPSLAMELNLMPGSVVFVLGAPGVGKSIFALDWCIELALAGHWSRLVSLDTPAATQASRVVSKLTSTKLSEVLERKEWAHQILEGTDLPLLVMDQPFPPEALSEILDVDRMYLGRSPELVVIDDLVSLQISRDYEGIVGGVQAIKAATRRANSVTMVLHHLHRGGSDLGNRSPKLTDLSFAGEYDADVVLGLWRPSEHDFRVSILKNRLGRANPQGGHYLELRAEMEYSNIRELWAGERGTPNRGGDWSGTMNLEI